MKKPPFWKRGVALFLSCLLFAGGCLGATALNTQKAQATQCAATDHVMVYTYGEWLKDEWKHFRVEQGECTVEGCGYSFVLEYASYSHVYTYLPTETTHVSYCETCGYVANDETNHRFVTSTYNDVTYSVCTVCYFVKSNAGTTTYTYGEWGESQLASNDTYHFRDVCDDEGSIYKIEKEEHSYEWTGWLCGASGEEVNTGVCTVCGYTQVLTQAHQNLETRTDTKEDGTHVTYTYCTDCAQMVEELSSEEDELVFGEWTRRDDGTYVRTVTCTCGYTYEETFTPPGSGGGGGSGGSGSGNGTGITLQVTYGGSAAEGAAFALYTDTLQTTAVTDEEGTIFFPLELNKTYTVVQTCAPTQGQLLAETFTVALPLVLTLEEVEEAGLDKSAAYYSQGEDTYTFFTATYTVACGQTLTMPLAGKTPNGWPIVLGACLLAGTGASLKTGRRRRQPL